VINDRASFFSQEPSELFIDAIENSVLRVIRYESLRNLEDLNREQLLIALHRIYRHTLTLQNRILQLISMTAQERYADFMKTYPDLHNRVPQRMIASYLGITPEGLSRVRKEK
jgi:CRP-like cAMP-binding protein